MKTRPGGERTSFGCIRCNLSVCWSSFSSLLLSVLPGSKTSGCELFPNVLALGRTMNYSRIDFNPQQTGDPSPSEGLAHEQLENACRQQIYAASVRHSNLQENSPILSEDKGSVATLFARCEWNVNADADTNTLAIQCPDLNSNLLVFEKVMRFAGALKPFSISKVCVSSPANEQTPLEVRVDDCSGNRN